MHPFTAARAPVTITPLAAGGAPIAIAFTTFPSLVVRYGRWHVVSFPACGCDACDETTADEARRLGCEIAHVVAGRFREERTIPLIGDARLHWALGDCRGRQR